MFTYREMGLKDKNVPSNMCTQGRPSLACASAQSDQSLRCPFEGYGWRSD